jgi:hypothetical protein
MFVSKLLFNPGQQGADLPEMLFGSQLYRQRACICQRMVAFFDMT